MLLEEAAKIALESYEHLSERKTSCDMCGQDNPCPHCPDEFKTLCNALPNPEVCLCDAGYALQELMKGGDAMQPNDAAIPFVTPRDAPTGAGAVQEGERQ